MHNRGDSHMDTFHVQIDEHIAADTAEEAAREFADRVNKRGVDRYMIDVFSSDITQGMVSDDRVALFDPQHDFEVISR